MSPGLELRILGPLELLCDGVPVPVDGVKPRQVLATLALHHRRTVSVDQLIEVLWPTDQPRSAVANVQTYVSALRTRLGARLQRRSPGYRLELDPAELDAERFRTAAADPTTVDEALSLWRGEPVENLPAAPLWRAEIVRLLEQRRLARQLRARVRIARGAAEQVLADLRALVTEDPIGEEGWLLLVGALRAVGRRGEALAAYADARRILAAELGVEPGEPLRALHRELLLERQAPAALGAAGGVGAGGASLDADAAAVLRGIARLGLGPVPSWVAAALLGHPTSALSTLESARLVRRCVPDAAGQSRFSLPTLVGLVAGDMDASGDDDGLVRVLAGYLTLAERAGRSLPAQVFGPASIPAPRWPVPGAAALTADPNAWFAAEREALVAAVEAAASLNRVELVWALAHALMPWCDLQGQVAEWEQTHRTALAACRRAGDLLGEAVTQRGLGQLHLYQDRYELAAASFGRSRLLFARLGDECGEAGALAGIGAVHRVRGELAAARGAYELALKAYGGIGDRRGEAYARGSIALVLIAQAEYVEAEQWLCEGLQLASAAGDAHRTAHLTHQLGVVRLRRGDLAAARSHLTGALDRFTALGDAHGQAYCLSDLAALEPPARAQSRLTAALDIVERIGDRSAQAEISRRLGELLRACGQEGLAEAYLDEAHRLDAAI